jgi:hypothetical protein
MSIARKNPSALQLRIDLKRSACFLTNVIAITLLVVILIWLNDFAKPVVRFRSIIVHAPFLRFGLLHLSADPSVDCTYLLFRPYLRSSASVMAIISLLFL